jgi:hypothetical protein
MTIDELISELENIRDKYGGNIPVYSAIDYDWTGYVEYSERSNFVVGYDGPMIVIRN